MTENEKMRLLYEEKLNETLDAIRICTHDYRHHLSALATFLETAQWEKARQYVAGLVGRLGKVDVFRTGNAEVDAVINGKYGTCFDGLELFVEGELPEALPFDAADLVILIGNAMDNAEEACRRITDPAGLRGIIMGFRYVQGMLLFDIENPMEGCFDPVSRKEDGERHGYGLRSIREVVNRYAGFMETAELSGRFRLSVCLQSPKE